MSTERTTRYGDGPAVDVVTGSVSGLVAAAVGGIVLQLSGSPSVLTEAMPTLVGAATPAPVVGWLLFALVGAGLGVCYAAALHAADFDPGPVRGLTAGASYGVVLWVAIAVVFVPLAMPALGYAAAPAFPYLDPVALAGYVAFGAVLGYFQAALAPMPAAPTGDLDAGGA